MITKTVYNEQTRLTASLLNLTAVGLIAAGTTTPLVGAFYGIQIWHDGSALFLAAGVIFWLGAALAAHLAALFLLRSLIE